MKPICEVRVGDCREVLPTLAAESVHCCVTSPPYWGLRDYGTGTWQGGDPACDHVVGELRRGLGLADSPANTRGGAIKCAQVAGIKARAQCPHCGAVRVDRQIGQETTPADYVATLVAVAREIHRVLRPEGTLWLNLGDSYASGGRGSYDAGSGNKGNAGAVGLDRPDAGLKPKDLVGIPWRVALALQADGWYLRQDIIWHKPNPMPESVTDRCTKAHEYLFLLSKGERYYFDAGAIAEPATCDRMRGPALHPDARSTNGNSGLCRRPVAETRNRRSVWTVATRPYAEAHFATYPPELIAPCILAGCPVGGTVLDPFGGSGTTGQVALERGRSAVLIELNPDYAPLIQGRTQVTPGLGL